MKKLVTLATIAFWAIFALALARAPEPAATTSPAPGTAPSGAVRPKSLTAAEVARHDRAEDCWMIIDAQVYDFTAYLPLHPADPAAMLKYCGKDGSEGFLTKDRGRAHSSHARSMMANYLLGPLQP